MTLSEEIKQKIKDEYASFEEIQYNGKALEERRVNDQFFTPAELTIQMIEQMDNLEGTILDPAMGAGGLIAGCIIAGADPTKCYGIEYDEDILINIARPRLRKLGVPDSNLHFGNALNPDCYDFGQDYSYYKDNDKVRHKKFSLNRKRG